MSLQPIFDETRKLLTLSQFKEALKLLKPLKSKNSENVEYLQLLAEVYLEVGKVDKSYELLDKACRLDESGKFGSEKFFYLGQIIGGSKGIEFINHGIQQLINKLEQDSDDAITIKKLNQGIFTQIEIWMTDLCMEPEAESKCNELIQKSLSIDGSNPETWSLLASIRISQQLDQEAIEAIEKSWSLFEAKKTRLEDIANGVQEVDGTVDVSVEYVELIQPLLTLSRYAIELGNYELGGIIASSIRDIDEDNLESYFIEGFSNYLIIKKQQYDQVHNQFQPELFEGFVIDLNKIDQSTSEILVSSQKNLSMVLKIYENSSNRDEIDVEIIETSNKILNELGGAIDVKFEEDNNIDEDNWEDEIVSDED